MQQPLLNFDTHNDCINSIIKSMAKYIPTHRKQTSQNVYYIEGVKKLLINFHLSTKKKTRMEYHDHHRRKFLLSTPCQEHNILRIYEDNEKHDIEIEFASNVQQKDNIFSWEWGKFKLPFFFSLLFLRLHFIFKLACFLPAVAGDIDKVINSFFQRQENVSFFLNRNCFIFNPFSIPGNCW